MKLLKQCEYSKIGSFFLSICICLMVWPGNPLKAQVKSEIHWENGNPSLVIDGESHPPFAYMSYLGEEKYYKETAASGIHLYNFPAYLGEGGINTTSGIGPFRSPVWTGENTYDFSSIITDFEKIIRADPKAKVIIRFYLDPPSWWTLQNPEAAAHLPDGTFFRQCFASEEWREKTGKVLQDCLGWLLQSKYQNHLAGIHLASGFTEEWFYHPKQYEDQNPVRLEAFRGWLKKKYASIQHLRKVWNNSLVTFEQATLAPVDEPIREIAWRDPEKDQNYIDTYQFHTSVMVDNIAHFSKIVKDNSNGRLLTGAFYGYHYFVTDPRRGHGALASLLDCPNLDYLSSPNVYNRVMGEDWPPMVAINSVHLHGKLWLAENDTRTAVTTLLKDRSEGIAPTGQYETGVWLGPEDIKSSVALLWKNAARMLAFGYGGWWFDMWGGWFSDPELLQVLARTQQISRNYPPKNPNTMRPSVLVIVDEELSFWDKSYGQLAGKILSNKYPIAKTGSNYDLFLRTDLEKIQDAHHKVIWLMGLLRLSSGEKEKIRHWQKTGKTVLWTNAKGTALYVPGKEQQFMAGKLKWTPSELGKIWDEAGVHRYVTTEDICYAGRNWLSLHTLEGGEKSIRLPFYAQVIDPLENKILSDSTNQIHFKIAPGTTRIFRINPY
jgi:beta-galactosidase